MPVNDKCFHCDKATQGIIVRDSSAAMRKDELKNLDQQKTLYGPEGNLGVKKKWKTNFDCMDLPNGKVNVKKKEL